MTKYVRQNRDKNAPAIARNPFRMGCRGATGIWDNTNTDDAAFTQSSWSVCPVLILGDRKVRQTWKMKQTEAHKSGAVKLRVDISPPEIV